MNTAVLIDWNLFIESPYVQDLVSGWETHTRVVLLVEHPDSFDYEADTHPTVPEIAWDMVIRNSGGLDSVTFKEKAIKILKEVGDTQPVIGLDRNLFVSEMYKREGVLITVMELP